MKRFAKITAVLAAMVLALAFIGCSSGDDDDEPEEKFVTFTTADGKNVLKVYGLGKGNEGEYELTLDEKPSEGTWTSVSTVVFFTTDDGPLMGTVGLNAENEVITIVCEIGTFVREGHEASEVVPNEGDDVAIFKTTNGDILIVLGLGSESNEGNYVLIFNGKTTNGTWKGSAADPTVIYITPAGEITRGGSITLDGHNVTSISFKIEGKDYTFTPAN